MKTRAYKESDYDMIKQWWLEAGCPAPHPSQLETTGVIGLVDDQPVCAVWIYRCIDVPIAWLEHFVTNPLGGAAMRKMKAVIAMMDKVMSILKEDGYQMIRATTWSSTLGKVCKKRWGFQIIDGESTNMSLII